MRRHLSRWVQVSVAFLLVSALLAISVAAVGAAPAADEPISARSPASVLMACGPDRTQASGAIYRICMPSFTTWNGDLIVYAHGYMAPNQPVHIPEDQLKLPDGTSVPNIATFLGYAFATTSYSVNGLAVQPALVDLVDLVRIFKAGHAGLRHVILVGVSEGGLITTIAVEKYPNVFDGGLAGCGPIGDFEGQSNYLGDFRVVFDYFFPGLMPGTVISIPESALDTWDSYYAANILPVISDPGSAISVTQLLSVTKAPIDAADPVVSSHATISGVLWYDVFAINDATAKLGGQPFDNQSRVYAGSSNDAALNAAVPRFAAEPAALQEIQAHYQTNGVPLVPLVTLHTTGDPIVPYWHEALYGAKIVTQRRGPWYAHVPVAAYGHCRFSILDIQQALGILQAKIESASKSAYWPLIVK
jgi:pimeloyl-ACP methyl ester carboxylesterase